MKTLKTNLFAFVLVLFPSFILVAQDKGNGNVIKQERDVAVFDAINVGCAINLFISQGDMQTVSVETDENLQNRIKTKVSNGELILSCDNIRNATKMDVYVTVQKLYKLDANGAAIVKGQSQITSDNIKILASGASKITLDIVSKSLFCDASGASKANLTVKADEVTDEVSGAANLKITGIAAKHKTDVSGAGNLKSMEFVTDNTDAEVSGAGNASVMARKQLKVDLSGAGSLTYFDNSEVKKIGKTGEYVFSFSGMDNVKSVIIDENEKKDQSENEKAVISAPDEDGNVEVTIDNNKIVVVTDDSVKVKLGDNSIVVDEDGDVKINHNKKKDKFNGHWKGLELGVNGYLTPNNDFEYPADYKLLEQKYQKSINVNLNFLEQNVNLINNHLGLVTGLGLSWNNYRFENDVRLGQRDQKLELFTDTTAGLSYKKSKLVNTYLTVPLMLELQTNRKAKANSFHISAGVVGGWKIGTHAKYVYDNGSIQKDKDRSSFYMNPFKVDAIAKVGWGVLNLYATYSLTPMFQKNKGPELYPFSIGICLTDLSDL
jgi:hypothetical protein